MSTRRLTVGHKTYREQLMKHAMLWLVGKFGRDCGIALFTFDFGHGRNFISYQSNADRQDVLILLQEWLRLNGNTPTPGTQEILKS